MISHEIDYKIFGDDIQFVEIVPSKPSSILTSRLQEALNQWSSVGKGCSWQPFEVPEKCGSNQCR